MAKVVGPVRVRTVFAKATHLFVLVEFTLLRLVVIVRNVEKLELHLYWEGVHLTESVTMSKNLRLLSFAAQHLRVQSGKIHPWHNGLFA